VHVWLPSSDLQRELGPIERVTVEVVDDWRPDCLPSTSRTVEVVVPPQAYSGDFRLVAARLPRLRIVQALTAGVDIFAQALPSTVDLYNASGIHVAATAEWTVAAILACERQLLWFEIQRQQRTWSPRVSRTLSGATVLIIGAGEIGLAVGDRLAPFGARIRHVARHPRDGVDSISHIHDLLPEADIVVLLVPLTPETTHLVDREFLAAMRDGALLVSAARGGVVDTAALVRELASGRLRAALDVLDPEPPLPSSQVWSLPTLLLTPHVASSVPGVLTRQAALLAERLPAFARGERVAGARRMGY
jgi:phosphoglycerate dehydrogenase-like enzyme